MKSHRSLEVSDFDRLAVRSRPERPHVMHQNWGKLLFLHWPVSPSLLRPLLPEGLQLDTFQGGAWIAITPFTIWNAHPAFLPPVPGLGRMHELNVRTYVHLDGVPGVWFFSLDLNSFLGMLGGRYIYHLPYYHAYIQLHQRGSSIDYRLRRTGHPSAEFAALYSFGEPLPPSQPGSLEFFLTERYCLYTWHLGRLYRARIFHQPWPLRTAQLESLTSTMFHQINLPAPAGDPHLLYAESLSVDIWGLEAL
jgi:uncharacterized protein